MKTLKQLYAFIITSKLRKSVLNLLYKHSTLRQTPIAKKLKKKQQNIRLVLLQLEKEGLVECLTPEKKAWKVYAITQLGKDVARYVKKSL